MIKTEDLTKQYGKLFALKNLKLNLVEGDLFGFIGPNGSGKTTTMKILATLLQPSWGEAYVCDLSIYTQPKEIRRLIGFMPDFFGVYDDMKVIEYLEFFAAAYRIKGAARQKVCNDVLELVDLGYKREALVTSLSRGMTQRLGLARVLLHDPKVLLLDEPASGLDPRARIEIRELLKRLGTRGKTIMVSSHILPELADVCNKVGIIERGELLVNSRVDEVMRQVRDQPVLLIQLVDPVCLAFASSDQKEKIEQVSNDSSDEPQHSIRSELSDHSELLNKKTGFSKEFVRQIEKAARLLSDSEIVESAEVQDDLTLRVFIRKGCGAEQYSGLPNLLIENGFRIQSFREEEINLETAFMALTRGITS